MRKLVPGQFLFYSSILRLRHHEQLKNKRGPAKANSSAGGDAAQAATAKLEFPSGQNLGETFRPEGFLCLDTNEFDHGSAVSSLLS